MENPIDPPRPGPARSPPRRIIELEDGMAISPDSPRDASEPLANVRVTERRRGDSVPDDRVGPSNIVVPPRRQEDTTNGSNRVEANSLWNNQGTEEDLFGSDDELYDGDDGEAPTPDHQHRHNNRRDEDSHQQQLVTMKTTYPSDRNWSRYPAPKEKDGSMNKALQCLRMLSESISLLPPFEGAIDYAEAVESARFERQQLHAFEGYEESDGPPWMSQHDGQTVIVDVVDRGDYTDFLRQRNEAKEYLEQRINHFNVLLDMEEGRMVMAATETKAFYSYPVRKLWNIKADMEIRETDNSKSDALMKIRPDSYHMKSLMYRGHMGGSFGEFLTELDEDNGQRFDEEKVGLLRHLSAIDNLEVLFLEVFSGPLKLERAYITEDFVSSTCHKMRNLKVLSFGPGMTVQPEALLVIGQTLSNLERLDISFALSSEYSYPNFDDIDYDSDSDRFEYYDFALQQCVISLQLLVRLDIGAKVYPSDGYEEAKAGLVPINPKALATIESVMKSRGGIVTRSAQTLPPPWPAPYDQKECRKIAVQNIINNPKKDADLRNIAYWQLMKRRALDTVQNEQNATESEPVVVEEDLGCSPHEELTVTSNSSNKRRHDEIDTTSDTSKVPRLP